MARETQQMKRRKAQLEKISGIVEEWRTKLTAYRTQRDQYQLLLSVATGLYEEVDKVSKKAPAEPVTNLVYEEVNQVIKEAKELAQYDPYMQRLKQFVAAGENPPYRDVVVALKLMLQGLERFREHLDRLEQAEVERGREARAVQAALNYYVQNEATPNKDDLRDLNAPTPSEWFEGYPGVFDFARLDRMDMDTYFSPERSAE